MYSYQLHDTVAHQQGEKHNHEDGEDEQHDHINKIIKHIHRSQKWHKKHHRTKHRRDQRDDDDTMLEITVNNLKYWLLLQVSMLF